MATELSLSHGVQSLSTLYSRSWLRYYVNANTLSCSCGYCGPTYGPRGVFKLESLLAGGQPFVGKPSREKTLHGCGGGGPASGYRGPYFKLSTQPLSLSSS